MPPSDHPTLWQFMRDRRALGWMLYDWANSAYVLCVITVIGAAFFVHTFNEAATAAGNLTVGPAPALRVAGVALTAEAAWSFMIALSAMFVAFSSPLLGAMADGLGAKRRFLAVYCLIGAGATLALWYPHSWAWVGALILLANIGYDGGNVYYNAFLPGLGPPKHQDVLSSLGYAAGYIGGVLVLIAALIFFTPPRGSVHNAFLVIGLWWGGFGMLAVALLREGPGRMRRGGLLRAVLHGGQELATTLRQLRRYPQALLFLGAFLLYNDGIATLISNATPYALQNIYLDKALTQPITLNELIPAIIMIQIIAAPGALLFAWIATRWGEKTALFLALAVFTLVVTYGQVARLVTDFYVMAAFIGLVLGGAQAISRALFASFIPAGKSAEYFAFFALSSRFSAMGGPLIYGGLLLLTGNTRLALLSLTVLFCAGGGLLYLVNVEQGRMAARRG